MSTADKIEIIKGDITTLKVDAIVNSAHPSYLFGGGVCGAIFSAAGIDEMETACENINFEKIPPGQMPITPGFNLPTKYVIHAVAPQANEREKISDEEKEKLANCYKEAIFTASQHGIKTLAFPSLGTGIFALPIKEASEVAMNTIFSYLNEFPPTAFEKIIMVTHSDEDFNYYKKAYEENLKKSSNIE